MYDYHPGNEQKRFGALVVARSGHGLIPPPGDSTRGGVALEDRQPVCSTLDGYVDKPVVTGSIDEPDLLRQKTGGSCITSFGIRQ